MMSDDLYRLVYFSRNHIPGPIEAQEAEVAAILDVSRRNNVKVGVTGALMFNKGCFGQVLEGPQDAVEATFERIQRDLRHSDVTLLAFEWIPERSFATWSMAYVGAGHGEAASYDAIGAGTGFDPSRMAKEELLGHLTGLVRELEEEPVY
jgi:hypothetical protein